MALEYGPAPAPINSTLHHEIRDGTPVNVVQKLLANGCTVHDRQASRGYNGRVTQDDGNTPLHTAAAYAHNIPVIDFLLAQDADINATNKRGYTPLGLLFYYG